MDVFEALYTTRAMRRVKPDPIPMDVQARILDTAVRAPSGGNSQGWRFLLVDDRDIITQLAPLYRDSVDKLWSLVYADRVEAARANPDAPEHAATLRMVKSVEWMADNLTEIPLLLFAFARGDAGGGSTWPAIWSAQLAARAFGVGSAPTSILGAFHQEESFKILGVPADKGWTMMAMVSFGYPKGRWAVAERRPAHEVAYRNQWGADPGFSTPTPLWP